MNKHDIAIIGAGVVGLSAALRMAQLGFEVALIDAMDNPALEKCVNSRVYALNAASEKLLTTLGVWPNIDEDKITAYDRMHVWDEASGAHIDFDSRLIAEPKLGVIVAESALKKALLKQIELESKIKVFFNTRITAIHTDDERVKINAETNTWQSRMLFVCDGAESFARKLLGVGMVSWPYHQSALVATVGVKKPHQRSAFQVFTKNGPLAFLPLADPNQCSIVWSTSAKRAAELARLDKAEFEQQLERAFESKLGQVSLIGSKQQFPLVMRHCRRYVGKNWLLMGDAAHTIHPLAGLGLNIGLADITVLTTCLANSNHQFSQKMLQHYHRQRTSEVWKVIAVLSGLKTLFITKLPFVAGLRARGLWGFNQLPLLKRWIISEANK